MLHTCILATALLLVFTLAAKSVSGANGTAYVSQTFSSWEDKPTTTLLRALANEQITDIVIIGDYSLPKSHEFDSLQGSPFPINRNLTIGSLDGEWPTIDLGFAYEILNLCSECLLRFKGNLTLANDRRGTNPTYDFVTGQPGSRVLCDQVYRQRLACTSGQESADTIRSYARSAYWPESTGPQLVHVADVWYKGKLYPDSMVVDDASFDVPHVRVEGRGWQGGYSQHCKNVVRICEHYVTAECLKQEGPEVCVNHLVDTLLTVEGQPAKRQPAVLAAAIAVPVVVVGLVAAAAWVYIYRRRKLAQQQMQHDKFGFDHSTGTTVSEAGTHRHSREAFRAGKGASGGSGGPMVAVEPKGSGKEWELVSSFKNENAGFDATEDHVEFGDFIGSGSFGRVYHAVYCGRAVAVKVVEHNASATEAVQHEMHLMMGFASRHVVAAYKCLTYSKVGAGESGCSADFSLYVAPCSTYNSAAGSHNPNATASPEWRGLADIHHTDHSTPPAATAATSGSAALHSSSRASGEDGQATPLATWLVQEYCDCGTLKGYVLQSGLPPRLAAGDPDAMRRLLDLLHGAALGLQALHDAKVVHGDLNCRNVLVASDCNTLYGVAAKIADLGVSRALSQHKTHRTTQNLGTITHSAPELLRFGRMSFASDVFSFGIMMWALYTGQEPYGKLLYGQFFETVVVNDLRPVIPADMPRSLATLIEHCWASAPTERPTTQQLRETLHYLLGNLPAQMAETQHPRPDAIRRVHSSPLPSLLAKAPRRQQKRQQQQHDLMAAAMGVFDMTERSDSLLPEPVNSAVAPDLDTAAGAQDHLGRARSQPVSNRDLPGAPHGSGLYEQGHACQLSVLSQLPNCELQLDSGSQGYQLSKEQDQQAWIV